MKITKYLAMMAAVVGMTAACQKEEFVTFDPSDVVVPTLHAVEDIVVTADNKDNGSVKFEWDAADFGVKAQIFYSLEMAKGDKSVNLFSGISGTSTSVSLESINNKAFNDLEMVSGEATEVTLTLSAKLNAGDSFAAAPVTAKVTPTSVEKVYPMLYAIGSFNGWSDDGTQKLFDFAEEDKVYSGLIGFDGKAVDGWKIRQTAKGWPSDAKKEGNWGLDGNAAAPEAEAKEVSLISDGGSSDLKIYSKNFYSFSLDKSAGLSPVKLTVNFSFDKIGVIGSFNNWSDDVVMQFNTVKQRFYADVEFAANAEFKFRLDGAWDVAYGYDSEKKVLTTSAGNIVVAEAGKYRVYLDMNNPDAITYKLDARAYGTDENANNSTGKEEEEEKLPEGARPVNILMKANDWETVNLYGWGGKLNFAWPGVVADGTGEFGGVKYSWWTLPAENWGATDMGLIFNNGTVQTVDIKDFTLDGDKAFELGDAGADGKLSYSAIDAPVVKVTYANEAGWEAVSIYGWGADGVTFSLGDWPGQAMTKEGDVWVYEIPAEHIGKDVNLIFNNAGAGAQTVDITGVVLNGDKSFDNENAAIK